MRRAGETDDDVFHMLEQELDWAELAVLPPGRDEIVESQAVCDVLMDSETAANWHLLFFAAAVYSPIP